MLSHTSAQFSNLFLPGSAARLARHAQKAQERWQESGHHQRSDQQRQRCMSCRALSNPLDDIRIADKRKSLLRFVQDVQSHDLLEEFSRTAPISVMDAMRSAVTNLLGTLPPSFFNVTVSAKQEDMAQIFYSAIMTGYMYRNVQYRIDLNYETLSPDTGLSQVDFDALQRLSIDEVSEATAASDTSPSKPPIYADGTQVTRVSGDVLRWRKDTETVERFDAQNYIKNCESEIASLRDQVSKLIYQRGTGNELLDFIKVQEPGQLKELTQHASTSVLEAMNTFIQRLVGSTGDRRVEVSNSELATTFYFLIVVGYFLRQLEVKCDFEQTYTVPYSLSESQE